MSLINLDTINSCRYKQNNFSQNPIGQQDQFSFWNFKNSKQTPKFNENLKLRYDQPEIKSEENLPDDKLIKLKQSPARQQLSIILKKCDNKVFSISQKDCDMMNIITGSGIGDKFDFDGLTEKFSISKTKKIISVIQGISNLDTANMTEAEMQSKANEFEKIVEQEKTIMERFRILLNEGVELAKELSNKNLSNKDKANIDKKITQFGEKFSAFVLNSSTESSSSNSQNNQNKNLSNI